MCRWTREGDIALGHTARLLVHRAEPRSWLGLFDPVARRHFPPLIARTFLPARSDRSYTCTMSRWRGTNVHSSRATSASPGDIPLQMKGQETFTLIPSSEKILAPRTCGEKLCHSNYDSRLVHRRQYKGVHNTPTRISTHPLSIRQVFQVARKRQRAATTGMAEEQAR